MMEKNLNGSGTFPSGGLLPKEQTQAVEFIKENPEFDGRGVTIAILDSGVDPGAQGLQKTTEGKPKIVNILDCSGSGDVTTTTVKKLDPESTNTIIGLSGKNLKIGNWTNPSGDYHLGIKSLFDLFPNELTRTYSKKRKEAFQVENQKLITELNSTIKQLESTTTTNDQSTTTTTTTDTNKQQKLNDLKARVEVLKSQMNKYKDPGIVMDCIVFHDGKCWRAAIDTNGTGDMTDCLLMTNYKDELEYSRFCDDSYMNFCVNIFDNGNLLSLVSLGSGSHGTHVASIAAGYNPSDESLNGVAPGAQIVSLKIGDNRVGSDETGQGMVRAITELAKLKCDLANMSYGEPFAVSGAGRVHDLLSKEVINKSGTLFVTSAGNSGPALSTVGAPGGSVSSVISCGAYVNESQQIAGHSVLEPSDDQPYTWSSRGPLYNGGVGYHIFAPGGAIASVPQYLLHNVALKNGTSMSSPNCCGSIALLLSGLKANAMSYNPYRIKSAIMNSAKDVGDSMNVGMIQVSNAWQLLNEIGVNGNFDLEYNVSFPGWRANSRGLYYRTENECSTIQYSRCHVLPKFMNRDDPSTNPSKLEFDCKVQLKPTKGWIKSPDFLFLNPLGRSFEVSVDPENLDPGFHFGEILGYDTDAPNHPLFRVPVSVCKPLSSTADPTVSIENVTLAPGAISRHFVNVPQGANYAKITVTSQPRASGTNFYCLMTQLNNQSRHNEFISWFNCRLSTEQSASGDESKVERQFSVCPGQMLEITLATFWNTYGDTTVDFVIQFGGLLCSAGGTTGGKDSALAGVGQGIVLLSGYTGFTRVDVRAPIRKEKLNATVTLDSHRRFIKPTSSKISPLKERDVLPNEVQNHELILQYDLKVTESAQYTARFPMFEKYLYDATWDHFAMMIFDVNSKRVYYGTENSKKVKLEQGSYTIKVQIVSHSLSLLDRLVGLLCVIESQLAKSITLPIFKDLNDIFTLKQGNFPSNGVLNKSETTTFWIGAIETLPKEAKHGDQLFGVLNLTPQKMVKGNLYTVSYLVPLESKPKDQSSKTPSFTALTDLAAEEPKKEDPIAMGEAVRDLEITWLKKMKSEKDKQDLLDKLEKEHPKHLPLYVKKLELVKEKLEKMPQSSSKDQVIEFSNKVVEVADYIISLVDLDQLAIYFGTKHDQNDEKEKNNKKSFDEKKNAIIGAYKAKGMALRKLVEIQKDGQVDYKLFDSTMVELCKWTSGENPSADPAYLLLWVWRQKSKGLLGCVLKEINKFLNEAKNLDKPGVGGKDGIWSQVVKIKIDTVEELGWKVWSSYENTWKLRDFPVAEEPF